MDLERHSTSIPPQFRRMRTEDEAHGPCGKFNISGCQSRAGAPPVRPLPLVDEPIDSNLISPEAGTDIKDAVRGILNTHGIVCPDVVTNDDHVQLVSRGFPKVARSARPTLLVVAVWSEATQTAWREAVKDMKRLVDGLLRSKKVSAVIDVEMVDPDLYYTKYISIVRHNPALEALWPYIRKDIDTRVKGTEGLSDRVLAIALVRMGRESQNFDLNPVTVYIAVNYEFEESDWAKTLSELRQYSLADPHKLRFHMEHNQWDRIPYEVTGSGGEWGAAPFTFLDTYSPRIKLGADIGILKKYASEYGEGGEPRVGTLGCYVSVKLPRNDYWNKVGLTHYRVARNDGSLLRHDDPHRWPSDEYPAVLYETDACGYILRKGTQITIEHPTQRRHNHIMGHVENDYQKLRRVHGEDYTESKYMELALCRIGKTNFIKNGTNVMGPVWYGSGLNRRSVDDQRLEWALILVANCTHHGQNSLPDADTWARYLNGERGPLVKCEELKNSRPNRQLDDMVTGELAWKVGGATGATAGAYIKYQIQVGCPFDKKMSRHPTAEHCFVGLPGKFMALPGDIGAVVYTELGNALGMVHSVLTPQRTAGGLTVVTPIDEVLEDIRMSIAAEDVQIYEEQNFRWHEGKIYWDPEEETVVDTNAGVVQLVQDPEDVENIPFVEEIEEVE